MAKFGEKMPDGTIYAGVSPDTGRDMFLTGKDSFLRKSWWKAAEYAESLDAHGHQDWRLPSENELKSIFNNAAAIGNLNMSGRFPAGFYWAADKHDGYGTPPDRVSPRTNQSMHGYHGSSIFDDYSSVRCVRG
jgi:hypothetical protein